jgi:hypothetical protein
VAGICLVFPTLFLPVSFLCLVIVLVVTVLKQAEVIAGFLLYISKSGNEIKFTFSAVYKNKGLRVVLLWDV